MHALGLEFGSAVQLSKRPGSVWNCLWGNALKRSPGIIRKTRVSYPGPGFLSSATWPSLPKKHCNGLNQIKPNLYTGRNVFSSPRYIFSPAKNVQADARERIILWKESVTFLVSLTSQFFYKFIHVRADMAYLNNKTFCSHLPLS